MSDKPSYVGLLNAIAVGESRGHELFKAWSAATENTGLKPVLEMVAIREHEHAAAFTKRLCELGFGIREKSSESFHEQLELAGSDVSDKKKFKQILQISNSRDGNDPFGKMFEDTTIDPQTGALLGRYIAEERDSGRCLQAAYDALKSNKEDSVLKDVAERLDKLSCELEELKSLRS